MGALLPFGKMPMQGSRQRKCIQTSCFGCSISGCFWAGGSAGGSLGRGQLLLQPPENSIVVTDQGRAVGKTIGNQTGKQAGLRSASADAVCQNRIVPGDMAVRNRHTGLLHGFHKGKIPFLGSTVIGLEEGRRCAYGPGPAAFEPACCNRNDHHSRYKGTSGNSGQEENRNTIWQPFLSEDGTGPGWGWEGGVFTGWIKRPLGGSCRRAVRSSRSVSKLLRLALQRREKPLSARERERDWQSLEEKKFGSSWRISRIWFLAGSPAFRLSRCRFPALFYNAFFFQKL